MGYNPRILNLKLDATAPMALGRKPTCKQRHGNMRQIVPRRSIKNNGYWDDESVKGQEVTCRNSKIQWTQPIISIYIYISILYLYLIGGLEHFLFFHSVGNVTIPTVTHSIIFQRGRAQPPTSIHTYIYIYMEHHHFQWVNQVNPLFLWPFSSSLCNKLPDIIWYIL